MTVTTNTGDITKHRALKTPQVLLGASVIEGIGGLAGVVLSILGLAHIHPGAMAAVAAIAIGAGFLVEGGGVASRYNRLMQAAGVNRENKMEIGGGSTAEFLGGAAGVVLGILALLNIGGEVLTESAAIVFGATLVASAGSVAKLDAYRVQDPEHPELNRVVDESTKVASGSQMLAGLGAIVLGIMALVGFSPMNLTLVAFLLVGASQLLSGTAVGGRAGEYEHVEHARA